MSAAPRRQPLPLNRQEGAILIVALIVCAVISISLGSYLALSKNSLTLANRSFYQTSALNLAETGVEEALWCFNQVTAGVAPATAWTGWDTTSNPPYAKRTFTDFTLSGGAQVRVRVLVNNYNPSGSVQPKVYSEATITVPSSSRTIVKVLEVDLQRRSRFAMGLVAKKKINLKGNKTKVDSWNSAYNDDGTKRGSTVPYSSSVRHASGSAGSTAVAVASVAVNNADIYGFVSVGSNSTTGVSVGEQGMITGNFSAKGGTVDYSRVATDFNTNFDIHSDTSTTIIDIAVGSFPTPPDYLGANGVTATYRYAGNITGPVSVRGNTTLLLTGSGEVLKQNGSGDTLTIANNATFIIYTAGDVKLTGGGVANPNNQASSFQIYGTSTGSQSIDIGGGASFNGVIYAPNAHITVHGDPQVYGSIVGNEITVVGNAEFHYDEALGNFGGNNPFGIVKWLELTDQTARTTAFAIY